ncbi:Aste57867_8893 [Aphanomyces stellatus]|uniref:Acylamino-acid-releasing enzyme n=1 Tax=Aphanomyces stellatus TaxID=120398 RepID=A0A485KLF5_9STRA|nr:hypothetical protein As57867_008858 [Aphanomyces stellatus]VFT85777.1 Aste57867_8893 [Aphanomyces stellatus]
MWGVRCQIFRRHPGRTLHLLSRKYNHMAPLTATDASALLRDIESSQRIFVGGSLVPSPQGTTLRASLVWKDRDLVNGTNVLTQTQHILHGKDTVLSGIPSTYPSQYVSHSPSFKSFVVVTDTDDKLTSQLAFYTHERLVHVHRTSKELHGGLYTGASEGGICWSEDESKIFYLAEQKEKEGKSFWSNANAPAAKPEDAALVGTQYDLKEDWGEQYVGKRTSRIFTMDVATGTCAEVAGIPESMTCSDVAVVPRANTILFTGIDTKIDIQRRFGLIYCFNRPKHIYSLSLAPGSAAVRLPTVVPANTRSPRVSPDGRTIAYLGTKDVVTHNTCNLLCVLDWATQTERVVVDVVAEPSRDTTDAPAMAFNGLYMLSLLSNCWSRDSKTIFVNTEVGARTLWKAVHVATGAVRGPAHYGHGQVGSETIVDLHGEHALIARSTPQTPTSIEWVHLAADDDIVGPRVAVETQAPSVHVASWSIDSIPTAPSPDRYLTDLAQSAAPLVAPVASTSNYEAIVWFPKSSNTRHPVIMDLHGGPHGHSPATFRASYTYLCALGYAVVSVNYRGSVGYGINPLESLVGKVGSQDVSDCHHALRHILDKYADRLDASHVHVSGGSHGGFLGSHLVGQFPTLFKSAVLRNPVTNLTSQFFTSDIPDWGCAVSGVAAFESVGALDVPQAKRSAIVARMWDLSPMANDLTRVKTPVLLGIGGKDRRVPPEQGLQFFHSLQRHGGTARVLWYPDDCHPLDSVKAYSDFAVNWALWLDQYNQ